MCRLRIPSKCAATRLAVFSDYLLITYFYSLTDSLRSGSSLYIYTVCIFFCLGFFTAPCPALCRLVSSLLRALVSCGVAVCAVCALSARALRGGAACGGAIGSFSINHFHKKVKDNLRITALQTRLSRHDLTGATGATGTRGAGCHCTNPSTRMPFVAKNSLTSSS